MSDFHQAVERFLAYVDDQRRMSRHTLTAYRSDLEQFAAYLIERTERDEPPGPEAIDTLDVRGFVARMTRSGLAKSSVARKLSTVRSFLKFAVREGAILVSPAVGIPTPKTPKLLPQDLTLDSEPSPLPKDGLRVKFQRRATDASVEEAVGRR